MDRSVVTTSCTDFAESFTSKCLKQYMKLSPSNSVVQVGIPCDNKTHDKLLYLWTTGKMLNSQHNGHIRYNMKQMYPQSYFVV